MGDVVIPRHFEYRVIRAKVSNMAIWNHLSVNRNLAQNIRRLEIIDERSLESTIVPRDVMGTDTDLESSDDELHMHDKHGRIFVNALARMSRLNEFVWSCNHSLISLHSIWPVLLKCQSLRSVEINDSLVFVSGSSGIEAPHSSHAAIVSVDENVSEFRAEHPLSFPACHL